MRSGKGILSVPALLGRASSYRSPFSLMDVSPTCRSGAYLLKSVFGNGGSVDFGVDFRFPMLRALLRGFLWLLVVFEETGCSTMSIAPLASCRRAGSFTAGLLENKDRKEKPDGVRTTSFCARSTEGFIEAELSPLDDLKPLFDREVRSWG